MKKILRMIRAQAASELAIFGAVLIFVLGLIVRYTTSFQYSQNQPLKAMRMAMAQSQRSSLDGNASRNSASVLFIEDRKDVAIGDFLSNSRTPFVVSGSGSFTRNMFMGYKWGHDEDLPRMDLLINGKYFQFTLAGYAEYALLNTSNTSNEVDPCPPQVNLLPGSATNHYQSVDNCMEIKCSQGQPASGIQTKCAVLYTRIPRESDKFCSPLHADRCSAAEQDDRFDLDRDGTPDVPSGARDSFSWQWLPVRATTKDIDIADGKNVSIDVDGDLKEETILELVDIYGLTWRSPDAQEDDWKTDDENRDALDYPWYVENSPISVVRVVDPNAGDLDFSYNTYDALHKPTPATQPAPQSVFRPGLMEDKSSIYTWDHGSWYRVKEGKLYATTPTKQYVRDVTKHDHVDMIERQIQLSNDTGHICGNGSGAEWDVEDHHPNHKQNPDVEACNDCVTPPNNAKTCFDEVGKVLYIRSRIGDISGRKWITDVSGDVNPIR